jgi:hypothetical protein
MFRDIALTVGFILCFWMSVVNLHCIFSDDDDICTPIVISTVLIIGILFLIQYRRLFKLSVIFFYSIFFIHFDKNTYYVPIIVNRRLMYIPFKRKRSEYYIVNPKKISDRDQKGLLFLNQFVCKIDKQIIIEIFHLKDNKEKSVLMSEL